MQTGVSIEMLCAELATKEIQHLRQDYEKTNIFFSFCVQSLLYGATQRSPGWRFTAGLQYSWLWVFSPRLGLGKIMTSGVIFDWFWYFDNSNYMKLVCLIILDYSASDDLIERSKLWKYESFRSWKRKISRKPPTTSPKTVLKHP